MEPTAQPNIAGPKLSLRLWFLMVLTGIGAGFSSGLLMKLLRVVQHACFHYQSGPFLSGVEGVSGTRRIVVLALAAVLTSVVLLLLKKLAHTTGGDVNEAIWKNSGDLKTIPATIKGLLSIVIVGMGVALGREAALKQAGAIIGNRLSALGRLEPWERTMIVACGTGAGMAAAYNVPFGGAMFAVEVLLGSMAIDTVLPALACSFAATAVSWLMLPNAPTYTVADLHTTSALVIWAILAGPVLGLVSAAYIRAVKWAHSVKLGTAGTLLMPMIAFVLLGIAGVRYPELLGNGKNVVQLAIDGKMMISLLVVLLFLRPAATVLCIRAGAPGGLFTPTMTLGAIAGAVFGQGWSHLAPHTDKRPYAMIGAGALMAAATQGPVSSVIFMIELTHRMTPLMVPFLLACAGATLVCRRIEPHSIYSVRD